MYTHTQVDSEFILELYILFPIKLLLSVSLFLFSHTFTVKAIWEKQSNLYKASLKSHPLPSLEL